MVALLSPSPSKCCTSLRPSSRVASLSGLLSVSVLYNAHTFYKDWVVAANRAFETTLKTICQERGWPYNPGDRASELVTFVRNRGLFPPYLDKGLDTYVAVTALVAFSAGLLIARSQEPPRRNKKEYRAEQAALKKPPTEVGG